MKPVASAPSLETMYGITERGKKKHIVKPYVEENEILADHALCGAILSESFGVFDKPFLNMCERCLELSS